MAARWLRGGIDGALQLGHQIGNRAFQIVRDAADGSPIMRLLRMNPNGLKQHGGGDVVGMGDKRDRHPGTDGLIFRVDVPRPPAGPVGEDKSARDRQQKSEPDRERPLPRFAHNSI